MVTTKIRTISPLTMVEGHFHSEIEVASQGSHDSRGTQHLAHPWVCTCTCVMHKGISTWDTKAGQGKTRPAVPWDKAQFHQLGQSSCRQGTYYVPGSDMISILCARSHLVFSAVPKGRCLSSCSPGAEPEPGILGQVSC